MLFNSFVFVALLLITFFIYYLPALSKHQIKILIISSLIFYAYDQFWLVSLLLLSATINILTSYYVVYGNEKHKRPIATGGVVANVLILCFFKYSPLISVSFFSETNSVGEFLLKVPLPIGISFFTFEGISLLVDVWKEKYTSNKNIVDKSLTKHAQHTLFFISFFPHLVSGPILKAHEFFPQIGKKYFKDINWQFVFKAVVVGYFLKMVVADNLKDCTHQMGQSYNFSTITLAIVSIGYTVQIFADFAGYSSIAIGLAKLFGYNFNINFNFPFISASFKEFWKRWHISLSTFLMEYLYIPLGGNRRGKIRTYVNLFMTMVLGGLWHGASWNFALWGAMHGGALVVERYLTGKTKFRYNKFTRFLKTVFVFLYAVLAFIPFSLTWQQTKEFGFYSIANLTKALTSFDLHLMIFVILYSLPVVIYHSIYLIKEKNGIMWQRVNKVQYIFYGAMIFLLLVNSGTSGSFIYFQF